MLPQVFGEKRLPDVVADNIKDNVLDAGQSDNLGAVGFKEGRSQDIGGLFLQPLRCANKILQQGFN
jgi:hypothetical protein